MRLEQYQVDAFTDRVFGGNPAAVVALPVWPDDALLQAIAEENNLSETAFLVPLGNNFELRWFTPVKEVDLCGHATLASAHVIFETLGYADRVITFKTRSGDLAVERKADHLVMDFPARPPEQCRWPELLIDGLGECPVDILAADDYLAVFDSEAAIRGLAPDQTLLGGLDRRGVIVTAPGTQVDFVSRFFAPKVGIPEDPVTGSAHCTLAPYWAERLGKQALTAKQVSKRGGDLSCERRGSRVLLAGQAVTVMRGELRLPG